jgi:pimeloyl-ACP methyl ester carboxylesterase
MAQDQVEVMHQLGHNSFFLAGHDRGGRVAHRPCLDHADAVEKFTFLDIAPTLTMYQDTNQEFTTRYVGWFFQDTSTGFAGPLGEDTDLGAGSLQGGSMNPGNDFSVI